MVLPGTVLEQDRAEGRARVSLRWDKSAALFPAALLFNLTGGLASFGIIFYARDVFHASAAQIGWLVAMPQIAYLAGCLFFPPLFGLLLARHYLIVATGGTALLLAGLLAARSLPGVFVLFGLSGFLIAVFWPPLMGWLARGLEQQPHRQPVRGGAAAGAGAHGQAAPPGPGSQHSPALRGAACSCSTPPSAGYS